MLLRCLEHAGVTAAQAVYVGDTELDCAAAAEAEMAYIGVGPLSGAERIVREVREVPGLLLG
jgi:phosphoglycolate phosphatase-like HAD superfamily hydrolase